MDQCKVKEFELFMVAQEAREYYYYPARKPTDLVTTRAKSVTEIPLSASERVKYRLLMRSCG